MVQDDISRIPPLLSRSSEGVSCGGINEFSELSEEFDDAGAEDGLVNVLADTADDLDEIIVLLEEKMEN